MLRKGQIFEPDNIIIKESNKIGKILMFNVHQLFLSDIVLV